MFSPNILVMQRFTDPASNLPSYASTHSAASIISNMFDIQELYVYIRGLNMSV